MKGKHAPTARHSTDASDGLRTLGPEGKVTDP